MSIEREYGVYVLTCDTCDVSETFEAFQDALSYVFSEGWRRSRDDNGGWQNICPTCRQLK